MPAQRPAGTLRARGARSARPWLLLPVEVKVREFHAKVLQAAVAAERGFDVVLGEQNALQRGLGELPRGIVVDKSVDRAKVPIFRRAGGFGNRLASWCEEGLVYRDRDTYLHERVQPQSLAQVDRFFAWGDVQRGDILRKAPDAASKVLVTGHPRFDLLRPDLRAVHDADVADIRRRFGRYLLVATNFSRFNHFMGYDFWIAALQRRGTISTDAELAFFRRWRDYIEVLYRGFVAVIPALRRAFPDHTIVVRPHPSENHDRWRQEMAGLDNVAVVFEGNAIPWIAGCEAMIHNSCTTGVEAYLLDRPTIAYRPATDAILDSHLPHALSEQAANQDELVTRLTTAFGGGFRAPDGAASEAARYIAAIDGAWAAERVADGLAQIGVSAHDYRPGLGVHARVAFDRVRESVAPIIRRWRMGSGYAAYGKQKFPGIAIGEITDFLARLVAVSGRFRDVTVAATPVPSCFRIERRG
jgi:surface carbohydrate biosynthesis protein